jgi:hypothetical protein
LVFASVRQSAIDLYAPWVYGKPITLASIVLGCEPDFEPVRCAVFVAPRQSGSDQIGSAISCVNEYVERRVVVQNGYASLFGWGNALKRASLDEIL